MRPFLRYLLMGLQFLGGTLLLTLAVCGGLWGLEGLLLYYGFILFLFFHYRYLRQNELMFLLAGAADTNQPLTSALWAYLADRPRSAIRSIIDAILLSAVFPGFWFWHRLHSYDRKVRALAYRLEQGVPLAEALKSVPGLAPREMVLAASVGQKTGKLAETLRRVPKWRVATLWLDLMPRFLYPLFLLTIAVTVVTYVMIFIIPKFEKIFYDFRAWTELPAQTRFFISASRFVIVYSPWFFLLVFVMMALVQLMIWQPSVRWHFPIVGRFYRVHVQGRVLKMLGLLLETGEPIPQALSVLLETGYFRGTVYDRLSQVRTGVIQGGELADELHRQGLLRKSMVPLVHSAQKMNHLSWALSEIGDHQARRTLVAAQRLSQVFFPIAVFVLALIIGFIAYSMFSPLLALLQGLEGMDKTSVWRPR